MAAPAGRPGAGGTGRADGRASWRNWKRTAGRARSSCRAVASRSAGCWPRRTDAIAQAFGLERATPSDGNSRRRRDDPGALPRDARPGRPARTCSSAIRSSRRGRERQLEEWVRAGRLVAVRRSEASGAACAVVGAGQPGAGAARQPGAPARARSSPVRRPSSPISCCAGRAFIPETRRGECEGLAERSGPSAGTAAAGRDVGADGPAGAGAGLPAALAG